MAKIKKEKLDALAKEWIIKNGCCSFDFKNKDLILHDGGLFSIESKKVKRHKILGTKKLPNGFHKVLFSKNKPIKSVNHSATIWFEEIEDTINYLKRLRKFLNKLGFKTNYKHRIKKK